MSGHITAAVDNFGEGRLPRELIRSYGEVKLAIFRAQAEAFGAKAMAALEGACESVIRGDVDERLPLPLSQGGAGTSIHLGLNEILAGLAAERGVDLDPIDDLARWQSTNDTFPTAVIAAIYRDVDAAETAVVEIQESLVALESRYETTLLTGRTETQPALPIALGQVCGAWAGAIERDRWRLSKVKERVRQVPLGGTAMGTCFNAPRDYVFRAERELQRITGLPLCRSQNLPDAVAHVDGLAEVASCYRLAAGNLEKIASDLFDYGLLGEVRHPTLQYGSSIMPAKTNPVLLELVTGLAIGITADAAKVDAYTRAGRLQLNAYLPFIYGAMHGMARDLLRAIEVLRRFLDLMEVDVDRMSLNLTGGAAMINALLPLVPYSRLKELAPRLERCASSADVATILAEATDIPRERLETWLAPGRLTGYLHPEGDTL